MTAPSSGRAGGVIVDAAQAACVTANARVKEVADAPDEQNPRIVIVTAAGKVVTIPLAALKPERGLESLTRAILGHLGGKGES